MKRSKQTSNIPFFSFLLAAAALFLGFVATTAAPIAAKASAVAESKAETHCTAVASNFGAANKAPCKSGYTAGYDGTSKTNACKAYSGAQKVICTSSFTQGQDDNKNPTTIPGTNPNPSPDSESTAEKKASAYCAFITGTSSLITKTRDACLKGFEGGYNNEDKADVCKGLSGSPKTACEDAFKAGDKDKTNTAKADGKQGATDKKTKEQACGKYKNADNKKTCEQAFDAQNGDSVGTSINKCGKVDTYFNFGAICKGTNRDASDETSPIIALALGILNFLAFGVSLVVAGGIVYGGIVYTTARDNASQTQKGITLIADSVVGLIAFFFLWTIINFVVPGGLF